MGSSLLRVSESPPVAEMMYERSSETDRCLAAVAVLRDGNGKSSVDMTLPGCVVSESQGPAM